ncbi:hypothetical protein EX895_002590 [Sporisorium graminicola]|uniref:RlpA-like protein double-psi beta-barrel domain-containing protein n=1 Tax=Sporisorium graminicola TaxID=280036 RepID=A0A4U7KVF5_9BASI|nr:hypothetical protein EX895_002590 [Sporisorium graminicola]TKY88601.1 hypothetical protein EX895_002590 [Sporisorium graminicola]
MTPTKHFSSLLLAAALVFALLLNSASAGLPSGTHVGTPAREHVNANGQHIGTPAKEHVNPKGEHIGTPAKEHVDTKGQHIGTPAKEQVDPKGEHIGTPSSTASSPELISPQMESLSRPRIASVPRSSSSSEELQPRGRHHVKSRPSLTHGKVTFYYGSQLLNPACPGAPTPDDWSMTAAISFDSPFRCGDRIRISDGKGKHVVVTAVDRCAGCSREWIDVTKGVFKVFDSLDAGVLHDLTFHKM